MLYRHKNMMGLQSKRKATYYGLENQGATCYLNSVLQVLFMTDSFREKVKSLTSAETYHIDSELSELFSNLEKSHTRTCRITNKLKINNVYEQRDAAEHYEKILRMTSPDASQIFHGKLINRSTCQECQQKTENAAGFWHLPLPLVINNNEYSVKKGIDDFFCPSMIRGDDQMYCEKCDKKCNAVLECEVRDYPEVLVLLLKRFEMIFDGNIVRKIKNNCSVKMPDTIHMEKTYTLYAFVEHFGELQSGHYNAKIKSPDEGRWYIFDDLNVEESGYQHFQLDPTETSKYVYLLFYRQDKGDASQTSIARPDTRETPLATATIGTKYTHWSKEEQEERENNTTEDTSAFSKDYDAQPVRPASKRGTNSEERNPKVEHPDVHFPRYGYDDLKEVKRKINKNHASSQDKRFQKNVNLRDDSVFQNHDDTVIDIPADIQEETSERHKRQRQAFDQSEHTKLKKRNVEISKGWSDRHADDFENVSSSSLPLSNIQYDRTERGDYPQMRQQYKKANQRLFSQPTDLGLSYSGQKDVKFYPPANSHGAVRRSSSFAPAQSSKQVYRNVARHPYMSHSGGRMRNVERFSVKSDRGVWDHWSPGYERTGVATGRHSFHGEQRKYRSQEDHFENLREMKRNDGRTEEQRRGPQNDSCKGKVSTQPQGEAPYSQPPEEKPLLHRTPQQCLERAEQKRKHSQWSSRESPQSSRSHKPKTRHDDDNSMDRVGGAANHKSKSPIYSPQNDRRSFTNHHESEITSDIFTEDVNSLTLNSTQETRGCQTLKKVSEMVLDGKTDDGKTKKKRCWRRWFCCWYTTPSKKKRPK